MNREASFSLPMRLALYESAYLNMFVNTGPGSLCILNAQCDYLYFRADNALDLQWLLQKG